MVDGTYHDNFSSQTKVSSTQAQTFRPLVSVPLFNLAHAFAFEFQRLCGAESSRNAMMAGFIPNTSLDAAMEDEFGDRETYRRFRKRRSSAGMTNIQGTDEGFDSPLQNLLARKAADAVKEEYSPEGDKSFLGTPGWLCKSPGGSDLPGTHIPLKSLHDDQEFSPSAKGSALSLKVVKQEPEEVSDSGESSFSRFASVLQAALRGLMPFPELILQFEACCKDLAEHVREEATERHRAIEDLLMRQKAQMLHDESATWALIWHLFGKGFDDMELEDAVLSTSQHEACDFISTDATAQLCFRIVKWLEGLISKALDLDKQHKGWYAGSYLQKLGVWRQTQHSIRKMVGNAVLVQHLDPDAPSRERARLQEEDQNLEEELLDDIWKLLRAGRLEEARQLCRSAGQPWRAATLGGCGDLGPSPSPDMLIRDGKDVALQAVELESGISHQRRLWKWACFSASERIAESPDESRYEAAIYATQCGNTRRMLPVCRDWESACWAIVKSWLEVQVDMELARLHPAKTDQIKVNGDSGGMSEAIVEFSAGPINGPESWPHQVLDQQPRDLSSIFQKLLSGDLVHENVSRSCKDQQRQIQMNIMLGEVGQLLDLLRAWIVPPQDHDAHVRSHGNPQMIRFGAHLVLVLRHILADDVKEQFREKLWLVGDLILNTYAIFLFTQRREELVGTYAAQLAPYLCEELYLHMMELRQNDSVLVKYKIFLSALENLPFGTEDPLKGSVSNILERLLSRSRDVKRKVRHIKLEEVEEHQRQDSLEKAVVVQWLCFAPPSNLENAEELRLELLARAAHYSNLLLREFGLVSLRRNHKMPVGVHMLLGYLVEPLKQPLDYSLYPQLNLQENVSEIQEWREYFTCDALYRNWLKVEAANAQIQELSPEEKDLSLTAANEAISAMTSFIQRRGYAWLAESQCIGELTAFPLLLEIHAVGTLVSVSGSCLVPDATVCTALKSSLFSCVGEDTIHGRQVKVHTTASDVENCVNINMQCLAVVGDGIDSIDQDGGLLGAALATAVKGEMLHFQPGLSLEVFRLDAWYVDKDGKRSPAIYITQGLCRRCCLPELMLRCMQLRVFLASGGIFSTEEEDLVEYVASSEYAVHQLFSTRQLQEFLLLEREFTLHVVESAENDSA
ncbi:hypothetical protein GOP47_0021859 [Adiantum capillus-veneris]|uniref:Nuclear pore complex protein n=1 Tax=Adiantum capillus-veneris TaxID=13818 RepID=A0A9D4U954_ADICA|nr:hypothetical protein GOP47_0021859 [Adiantum capillus-veneris]